MKGFFRTRGIKERMDTVKDGYSKGGIQKRRVQDRRDEEQEICWTVDRRYAGKEGCKNGGMQKGGMHEKEGCRKGRMQGRTGCRIELHFVSSLSYTTVINRNQYLFLTESKS